MSTILKALDRLDQEKAEDKRERPLREEVAQRHTAPQFRGPSRRVTLFGVGAGLAVLAIGLTLVFSGALTGTSDEGLAGSSPGPLAEVSAPAEGRAKSATRGSIPAATRATPLPTVTVRFEEREPAIQDSESGSGGRVAPPTEEVRELPASALVSEVAVIEPAPRTVWQVVPPAAVESKAQAQAAPASAAPRKFKATLLASESEMLARATPLPVTARPPPREALARATQPREASAPAADTTSAPPHVSAAPAPALRDVRVARTIWHPSADRRFAYVEVSGQVGSLRVREGDLVGRLSVQKIEPWGVVFLDDGIEIRHRVGAN